MDTKLIKMAIEARENAYVPYSGFKVGAALLAEDGSIYTGCNVENASFGGTVCAERVAYLKAVSEGKRSFIKIAIAGGKDNVTPTPPCGICRQVLSELCADSLQVLMATGEGYGFKASTLGNLLPEGFGNSNLE